jgi:hypothetical protein
MWDKHNLSLASAKAIEGRHLSSSIIMGTRKDALREARQEVPAAVGPLRRGHKAALKKIWDERPCLPSVASRKAWASARGLDPTFVNRWFYTQLRRARVFGFELDTENEGYDLAVDGGSLVEGLTPSTPLERDSILHSTTPEGLPELSCYEHSTSSETALRIPLSPGRSSSPIFGSSFYSPKLILDSSSSAYGHLAGPERFLFTPPTPLKRKRTTQSRSNSQHFVEEFRAQIHQTAYPLPASPPPNNRLHPLPLAPKKPRLSRGSHDILNFRTQGDPRLRFSPPTSSPTPMRAGYSVSYHIGPRERKGDDELDPPTFSNLRTVVAKTPHLTDRKQGGYIGDDQSLNHRDDKTTIPFLKCLLMMSVLYTIVQTVCPFQLSVSGAPIKMCIDRTAHLPSQAKRLWLHRVHRRPTNPS